MARERRYEPRRRVDEAVELRWEDGDGQSGAGTLREASFSGASVQTSRPIRVSTQVRISMQGQVLTGRVMHCVRQGSEFVIGLELDPESQGRIKRRRDK